MRIAPADLVFVDFEASSLGPDSFRIEAGWAFPDLSSGSLLIKPLEEWLEKDWAWDPVAEDVHGISRAQLIAEGVPVWEAARRLNEAWRGKLLLSDSPDHDWDCWGALLFSDAGIAPAFEVARFTVDSLLVSLADQKGIGDLDWSFAEQETKRRAPTTHRAEADALHHATFFHLLSQGREALTAARQAAGARPAFGSTRWKA